MLADSMGTSLGDVLFWVSWALLVANLGLRVYWGVYKAYPAVDDDKLVPFLLGAVVYMVEPNQGLRLMKSTLRKRSDGAAESKVDYATGERAIKHADKDLVAVTANRNYVAGRQVITASSESHVKP